MNVLGHDSVITGIHAYTCIVRLQIAHTFKYRYICTKFNIMTKVPLYNNREMWMKLLQLHCVLFSNNHQKNDDSDADVLASKFQIFYALYWYSWLAFICTDLKHKTAHILSKIFGFMCATGLVWFINLSTEIKVSNSSNSCANQASFVIVIFFVLS